MSELSKEYLEALQEDFAAAGTLMKTYKDGQYLMSIIESGAKDSKAGNKMWVIKWQFEDSEYRGQSINEFILFKTGYHMVKMKTRIRDVMPEREIENIEELLDEKLHSELIDRLFTIRIATIKFKDGTLKQEIKVLSYDGFAGGELTPDEEEKMPWDD
jgi:hypothetical protein